MEAHSLRQPHARVPALRSRKLLAAFGDERLVEQVRSGNDAAFEVLYDRHHAALLSYCRHMLGSLHEAEDALQQAFVSAHNGIVTTQKPINFKPWLYTIARNRCLTMLRARRERPSDELELVSTTGLAEEVQDRADLQQLVGDMQELPEEQRAALVLSELGDLSHVEVAEVIGCEAAKVKSLVFQARSGLIERRQARDTPCEEIREQLATLRGGSLRRGPLRRHVKECPGCMEFRAEVRRQRQMMAIVLPVVPTLGMRESALAAVGIGGSAAGGATAAGGLAAAVTAKVGAAKIAVIAIAASGAAVGGGVAVEQTLREDPAAIPSSAQPGHPSGAAKDSGAATPSEGSGVTDRTDGPGRSGENGARANGKQPGENARDFAAQQGNGRHLGLQKTPPGQTKQPAGKVKTTPPGQAKTPRGQSQTAPGRTQTAPGRTKTAPGQVKEPPAREAPVRPTPVKPETPRENRAVQPVKPGPREGFVPPGKLH